MNVQISLFVLVLVLVGFNGCSPVGPDPDSPRPEPVDPEPEPEPITPPVFTCETACKNQIRLECEVGEPTPKGATCTQVCENAASSGLDGLMWDVQKLTEAKVCEE